jgi:hypothetical protein
MKARALKYCRFERIEDHFRQGWVALIPNDPMHHHYYGIELAWICECPVPGGFQFARVNRVPPTPNEDAHERA